ncbi:hypothetical protein VTO73DRAFT_7614 [Trametes versicolor]
MVPIFSKSIIVELIIYMDFATLLTYRQTSHDSLDLVRRQLVKTMFLLVGRFVPNPRILLMKLERHGAFVAGSCALQFFLRHADVDPQDLDIFIPVDSMPRMLAHFLVDQAGIIIPSRFPDSSDLDHVLAEKAVTLSTSFGRVTLWQSEAHTPFLPITCGPTSFNFVYMNTRYFGCAYPTLLFNHRGIFGKPDAPGFEAALEKCRGRGLDVRLFTHMWRDLAHHGPCAAAYYACPAQQRTFSDAGSLNARLLPHLYEPLDAEVVWRLDDRPCGSACAQPTVELPIPRLLQNIL